MLTYPWKCTVVHCNHLGNTWKPLVLMTRHFDYCPSASEGDNQSVRSSAPVVSRCFPGGYNVKLYISRGRLAWWLLAFLHSELCAQFICIYDFHCFPVSLTRTSNTRSLARLNTTSSAMLCASVVYACEMLYPPGAVRLVGNGMGAVSVPSPNLQYTQASVGRLAEGTHTAVKSIRAEGQNYTHMM